jgi:hypothetical protein
MICSSLVIGWCWCWCLLVWTGRDLEEVEAELKGEARWAMGEIRGPFGTFANPTVVSSANPERVVGCLGKTNRPAQAMNGSFL